MKNGWQFLSYGKCWQNLITKSMQLLDPQKWISQTSKRLRFELQKREFYGYVHKSWDLNVLASVFDARKLTRLIFWKNYTKIQFWSSKPSLIVKLQEFGKLFLEIGRQETCLGKISIWNWINSEIFWYLNPGIMLLTCFNV